MMNHFFNILSFLDEIYWEYIGLGLVLLAGIYFSIKTKGFQIRVIRRLPSTLKYMLGEAKKDAPGVSPFKLFFASTGGMIGVGNVVAVVTAIKVGGPGALVWLWIVSIAGMLIKYAEIYLGMKYRKSSGNNGYHGSLMNCFPRAFKNKYLVIFFTKLACILLCISGMEVYQFTVVTDVCTSFTSINKEIIILCLLLMTIYIGIGGVKRVANICSVMMPILMIIYLLMCVWIIAINFAAIPNLVYSIFKSAFCGHAAIGGFVGSSFLVAAYQGAAKAVYSNDIAIGIDAIIQSESKISRSREQAQIAIISSITCMCICTLSMLIVLITNIWQTTEPIQPSDYIIRSLSMYFPYAEHIMTTLLFLAGFTTIQTFFVMGMKSVIVLAPKYGTKFYVFLAALNFWIFAHFDQTKVLTIMSLSAGMLVLINLSCILLLRKEICFKFLNESHHKIVS